MLGDQVTNQSIENGSRPFGGDFPLISLYRRRRRSRESLVSVSSTCNLAPSSTSSVARRTSRASSMTLRLAMSGGLGQLVGHHHRRAHAAHHGAGAIGGMARQQIPDDAI